MSALVLPLQQHPFSSGLGASLLFHVLLLSGFLAGWGNLRTLSFPADAIEVTSHAQIRAGAKQVLESKPKTILEESPVDLVVKPRAAKKPKVVEPTAAASTPAAVGQGGQMARSGGQALSEWEQYQMRVRSRFHEAIVYPRLSKELGEIGRVKVRFSVRRDGTIFDVAVLEPSAYERLNTAAVATVQRVAHLDPLPTSYQREQWHSFVPLDFTLQ